MVGSEHYGLQVPNSKSMKNSIQQIKKVGFDQNIRIEQSQVPNSNVYQSQMPVRLIEASSAPIHTPILEQFMH